MRTILVCTFLLGAVVARGQTPQQMFDRGNRLYQEGKLAEARDAYESVLRNGWVSGELYYNLGNAYYRTGALARAIISYERALRLMPADEDLRHNLQLANMMIADRIEPVPRLFFWDYWDALTNAFSLRGITWLCYTLLTLVAAAVAVTLLARPYALRRAALMGSAALAALLLLSLVVFAARLAGVSRTDEAVLTEAVVTVKNSPDAKSSDAFVLHAGVKVVILDSVGEWAKVRIADGKVGWVPRTAAETI